MSDEVIVITGANSGLGLGLVRALTASGARVVGLDLSVENLPRDSAFVCDVTDSVQVRDTLASIIDQWGRIDILVNNACLAVFAPFQEKDLADTRREFEVNYFGYLNMISAVLPHMKARGAGIIHNVSSTVGSSGFAGIYGYASTKGAIDALSRTLAIELGPYGITVNIVQPPLMRTPSARPLGVPAQFMADPEAVATKLARRIGSRKPVVAPGIGGALGAFMARVIPGPMGRLMSERAAAARSAEAQPGEGGS